MADTAADAHSRIAFSRSTGLPASLGKATETAKTSLPEPVKEDLLRRCREVGMSEADLLRSWVMLHLYGFDAVATMDRQRLEMAAAIGTEKFVKSVTNGAAQ